MVGHALENPKLKLVRTGHNSYSWQVLRDIYERVTCADVIPADSSKKSIRVEVVGEEYSDSNNRV